MAYILLACQYLVGEALARNCRQHHERLWTGRGNGPYVQANPVQRFMIICSDNEWTNVLLWLWVLLAVIVLAIR
jgi:hypothetical protein